MAQDSGKKRKSIREINQELADGWLSGKPPQIIRKEDNPTSRQKIYSYPVSPGNQKEGGGFLFVGIFCILCAAFVEPTTLDEFRLVKISNSIGIIFCFIGIYRAIGYVET